MADTSASGKPARGRGRYRSGVSADDATEPTPADELSNPTEPTGSTHTEPVAADDTSAFDDAGTPPPTQSRRRWSVPLLLFILVLVAAIAGWSVAYVAYRDKEDAEDQLDDVQQTDSDTTIELDDRIAELDARVEELESGQGNINNDIDERLGQLRVRLDACVDETAALIEVFQDAFGGGDVDDDAFDTQAGRTQRVCADVLEDVGTTPDDENTPSSPSTTTLP